MAESSFRRYFDVFTARPGSKKAEQHGRFAIPGESTMELPEGRVRIYYDINWGQPGDESGLDHPDDLEVRISAVDTGEEIPIRRKLASAVNSHETKNFTRCYVGRIEAPRQGQYKVTAKASTPASEEPHLSLGR